MRRPGTLILYIITTENIFRRGFEKSSVFKMVKFYQEFKEYEKVATLSQQLTWSHFVELLHIEDELKRDFMHLCVKMKTGL